MKNKKVFSAIAIAAVVAVIVSCCTVLIVSDKVRAYLSSFVYADEFRNEQPFSIYYFDLLNETEKKAYIRIFEKISSHPQYIKIPELSAEEFNNVYFAVKNDNPDMLCFSDSCSMISFWSASFIELNYSHSVEECDLMQNELQKEIDGIISEMPEFESDFEKELDLHDYVVRTCTYSEASNSSSAYGCLIEKKAVCSGYSRAVMLLMKTAGIDTILVGGTGLSPTQGRISHMWNVVWLDGDPYHLDATWDDPGVDDNITHLYFNLSDRDISSDHTDYKLSFECITEMYNYFRYNDLYFGGYGKNELKIIQTKLYSNIKNGINNLEIQFEKDADYNCAVSAITAGDGIDSDMYKIISYISTKAGEKVDVSHVNFASDDNKKYIRLMFDWN